MGCATEREASVWARRGAGGNGAVWRTEGASRTAALRGAGTTKRLRHRRSFTRFFRDLARPGLFDMVWPRPGRQHKQYNKD
jgi:hypothetical protein